LYYSRHVELAEASLPLHPSRPTKRLRCFGKLSMTTVLFKVN
jgi:hypothetical protein